MAAPPNAELEAAKFLHKLIQESTDEPTKLARKLYVILQHMRSSGKENSMPYQVISRFMEPAPGSSGSYPPVEQGIMSPMHFSSASYDNLGLVVNANKERIQEPFSAEPLVEHDGGISNVLANANKMVQEWFDANKITSRNCTWKLSSKRR
ncbi:hypothetical protein HYC85_032091 [Camellia sinensis]|uniref:Uncharacterized protein n=1 Tax=Camellia sinensis TaxID=4442 RepID=A0A7J7FU96_CAMSI|nr:hypothetical protein HYC85_032091 [Camellia sinensis]